MLILKSVRFILPWKAKLLPIYIYIEPRELSQILKVHQQYGNKTEDQDNNKSDNSQPTPQRNQSQQCYLFGTKT
jgi:hypothetical protein